MKAEHYKGKELQVIILADKEGWYAQGFEIDHDAEGNSIHEDKSNFEKGLAELVSHHLKTKGSVEPLLNETPPDLLEDLWSSGSTFTVSYISLSERRELSPLPFSGISYFEPVGPFHTQPSPSRIN